MGTPATVHLVPHTHWDREWYEPFQRFRIRLVDLVDGVLGWAEAAPGFCFTFDGQTAMIDDYLEIRPEAEPRIRALVASGQLAVGPWRILSDEFLVSGETLVRNLEMGWGRAQELGGGMPVGYLPDEFGHCAQMPQLLVRAGFGHAALWRGVPAAVERHAFCWTAPDGSSVRAEYLVGGYANAVHLFAVPGGLARRVATFAERMAPWFGDDPVLAMYGTDHFSPLPNLVALVETYNAEDNGRRIVMGTLAGYVAAVDRGIGGLPVWRGELRSSARANVLMGVTSARVDLKAACTRAERLLERYAEPLQALHGARWPRPFLELAARRIVDSSGHDSVTGCGADAVADQVLVRLAEAEQIASALRDRAAAEVAGQVPAGAAVVLNPSPFERAGLIELDLAVPEGWDQVAVELPDGRQLPTQEAGRSPGRRRLLADVPVPPLGWTAVRPVEAGADRLEPSHPVEVTGRRIANGLIAAEVLADGSLRVSGGGVTLEGVGRLVDGGDAGDLYNYGPPPVDLEVDEPESVTVAAGPAGPLRGELAVHRTYRWPRGLDETGAARSAERAEVPVSLRVELRAGEPFLRLHLAFDNRCADHRLRLHVPLAAPAASSFAEGQFAVVERGRQAEGGHGELPLPTFPARGFVDAGGVAVLLDHVREYELAGQELAVTVLRAVGQISRDANSYRREPAGPEVPTPKAQSLGACTAGLGLYPHAGAWHEAGLLDQLERYQHELVTAPGTGPEGRLGSATGLRVAGAGVVLSALRRRDGWLELRLVCQHPHASRATVTGPFVEVRDAGLLGQPGPALPAPGMAELDLAAWEIRTLQLRPTPD